MKQRMQLRGRERQRGATAVEFAIIFPLFFAICYAIICFGMIFVIQQSLTSAASEGARAGLSYAPTLAGRGANAKTTALNLLGWLNINSEQVTVTTPQCSYDKSPSTSPSLYCLTVQISYTPAGWVTAVPFLGVILTSPLSSTAIAQIPQSIL